jgi:3-methyl-2-oxobutanoate hydroxymethyltransferase
VSKRKKNKRPKKDVEIQIDEVDEVPERGANIVLASDVIKWVEESAGPASPPSLPTSPPAPGDAAPYAAKAKAQKRLTIMDVRGMKGGEKIVCLTAYDFPTAAIVDESGVDVILVGDSLGNVVLGHEDTLAVTMDDMVRHTRAAARGVQRALLVGDLPFLSYQVSEQEALRNAGRLISEGGAQCVKLEGGSAQARTVRRMVEAGIPVMGHIGLTPQAVHQMGGYRMQGKTDEDRNRILDDALALQDAGAFSIVLECVDHELAGRITRTLAVPTIGIGAGDACDGQILVVHDMLGFTVRSVPRFVKKRADLRSVMNDAIRAYVKDVKGS